MTTMPAPMLPPPPLPAATLAVWASPLDAQPAALLPVQPGRSIASLLPAPLADEVVVCRYQGEWILRADWARPVAPGDHVEFHVRPQGGGDGKNPLRTLLTIALIVAGNVYGLEVGAALGLSGATAQAVGAALINIGGQLALNAVLPVSQQQGAASGPQASPSYNVAIAGNAARLDGCIPVLYGYNRTYPDFAAQPYASYDNDTSDQYYHALLAVGHGSYDIPRLEIDDTPIEAFADVEYNILGPGVAPSLVSPAVVTAPEVTGQELAPGRYVGAFAASAPTLKAVQLAFDMALGGLAVVNNDGSLSPKTVSIRMEARPVDDWGAPTGAWAVLGTVDITASTVDAVRRSYTYTVTAGRYLARVVRTSAKDESRQVLNTIAWVGLRATLQVAAPLEPSVTHIEIRMRASEQLNGLSQRKISATSIRLLPTWTPSAPGATTGTWGSPVATRNPAWALADKWRNAVYGDGLADSQIDLAGLYALAQTWDERQDRCDIVVDSFTDSASADQVLAATGRAAVIRRNGLRVVVRDETAPVPVTAYPARVMRPGSWSQAYNLPTSESPDGVIVEYFSNRAWDWREIECPAPGRTYTDPAHPGYDAELPPMSRPVRQRLLGITGAKHAEREGLYLAAKLVYRRRVASWSTELQGILPAWGSPVIVAPALGGWGRSGDVVSWDADTKAMGLTEPHAIGAGTHYVSLQRDDGSWTDAIVITAGADAYTVVLADDPDFALVLDAADRERPKYILGTADTARRLARMLAIEPAGMDGDTPVINLTAVIEDDRVHTADEALLPGEGEEQDAINLDPIDAEPGGGGGDGGGATLLLVELSTREVFGTDLGDGSANASFALQADGRAVINTSNAGTAVVAGEWLVIAPTTTADTGLFEGRATLVSGVTPSGPLGTWELLSTTRTWQVINTAADNSTATAVLTVEIRDVDTETVQDTATITLSARSNTTVGGG